MAKFLCDNRVKWRNVSSSPSSGNPAMSRRSSAAGISSATSPPSSGHKQALRPAEPLSKISFGSAARERGLLDDGSDKPLDLLILIHFSDAHQETIAQLRIPSLQNNSRNDFVFGAVFKKFFEHRSAQHEFIEVRAGENRRQAGLASQPCLRSMRPHGVDLGHAAQAALPQQGHVHRRAQG